MGIWEVQTYSVIRGKEEEHEEVIKEIGIHVRKMGRKYLCFEKLHGPVNAKVMVISGDSFADLEKFEADWWADEELTELGNRWRARNHRVIVSIYTFWKIYPFTCRRVGLVSFCSGFVFAEHNR